MLLPLQQTGLGKGQEELTEVEVERRSGCELGALKGVGTISRARPGIPTWRVSGDPLECLGSPPPLILGWGLRHRRCCP